MGELLGREQQLVEIKCRYKQGETAWHLNDTALLLNYCGDLERQVEIADGTIVGWLRTNKQLTAQLREVETERDEARRFNWGNERKAIDDFRRRAIEAVRALSDNQLSITTICARLEMLPATNEEVGHE